MGETKMRLRKVTLLIVNGVKRDIDTSKVFIKMKLHHAKDGG